MRRLPLLALGLVAVLAVVVLWPGGGAHEVRAAFSDANNVVRGLDVRMAGRRVGSVRRVETRDGHALVTLSVDRWPLRAGTRARIRFGPTAGYTARYVELLPGPAGGPSLPDGALLGLDATQAPVELDDVLRTFDASGRRRLGDALTAVDGTLSGTGPWIGRGLDASGAALTTLAGVLQQLDARPGALERTVGGGSRTLGTLAAHRRQVSGTVSGLAATLDELAAQRVPLAATLRALPASLRDVRLTLARTDRSVAGLSRLTGALAPGARELRRTARPVALLVASLDVVAPQLRSTLQRLTPASRPIARLLAEAVPVLGQLRTISASATPMLACVRPYGPELAGFLATWAGFGKNYDALGHYARAELQLSPFTSNSTGLKPSQVAGVLPGLSYAMPRAPGMNAGEPWYQPQCGVTEAGLDPEQDPESGG